VSDAWRGPWPNGTAAQYRSGRIFFDTAISECSAFDARCEGWIEFRAERGQVRCIHRDSMQAVRGSLMTRMVRQLAAWTRARKDVSLVSASTAGDDKGDSMDELIVWDTDSRESAARDDAAAVSAASTAGETDPLEWHDAMCDAHKLRSVQCRLVPTGMFRAHRARPYVRTQKTIGWLHDGFEWECRAVPSWLHVVAPGPVCAPFATREGTEQWTTSRRPWCVPVEQCVVFLDVQRSVAFSGVYMSLFVVLISAVALFVVSAMYYHRGAAARAVKTRKRSFDGAAHSVRAPQFANYAFQPEPVGARPAALLPEHIIWAATLQPQDEPATPSGSTE
jgi:hypothetical protein